MVVIALGALLKLHAIFTPKPWAIALQIAAALLMLWARVTFGMRSFHADARPTAGGLVTTGPYRYVRHPIYAAIGFFLWAGVLANLSPLAVAFGIVATVGLLVRIRCEETLVTALYPEYHDYSARTKRLLPGLW